MGRSTDFAVDFFEVVQPHPDAHIRFVEGGTQVNILLPVIRPQKIQREVDQPLFII